MSHQGRTLQAKKACTRCSAQKRRCDKVVPECGLCTRLHRTCKYEHSQSTVLALAAPPETVTASGVLTPSQLQKDIVSKLESRSFEEVLSAYCKQIEPWFPILPLARLQSRLPLTWDQAPLDITLLCLSVSLFTTPPTVPGEGEDNPSKPNIQYLNAKNFIASTEALGINSFWIVQTRVLVTLFEIAHGLYPAAFISIGATVRAADAVELRPLVDDSPIHSDRKVWREDSVLAWSAILILDRYIAVASESYPSLTRSRAQLFHEMLEPSVCSTHEHGQDCTIPMCRLAHLVEASAHLDKIHSFLIDRKAKHDFNMEELTSTVQTLMNFQATLTGELDGGEPIYAGSLAICQIALLLAFENGSKAHLISNVLAKCNYIATASLTSLLSTIVDTLEPLIGRSAKHVELGLIPPFVPFLVYKAAAIMTDRLLKEIDSSDEGLTKLMILRGFLSKVGERWLSGERYIKLLNEDTTPRILKAVESRQGCDATRTF